MYDNCSPIFGQRIKTADLSDFIFNMVDYICYTKKAIEHGALKAEHGIRNERYVTK